MTQKQIGTAAMLLWKRYMIVGTFFFLYACLALYMATVSTDCVTSVRDKTKADLPPNSGSVIQALKPGINLKNEESKKLQFDSQDRYDVRDRNNVIGKIGVENVHQNSSYGKANTADHFKSKHVFDVDILSPARLLLPDQAPNTVFYVWCGRRWMEFATYLSILSVINTLKPDSLLFYYDSIPVIDSWVYNTWYKEITETYPFFIPIQLTDTDNACRGFMDPNPDFVYHRLQQTGGLYMSEYTILDTYPLTYKSMDFVYGVFADSKYAFVQSKRGVPILDLIKNPLLSGYKTKRLKCQYYLEYNRKKKSTTCVRPPSDLFPKDIWEVKSAFGSLVRRYFYGSPEIHLPQQNYDVLIPNIAHIVWIGGGAMDFLFYLGVVSLIYVAEVDMVYIHGDIPPSGPYWQRIQRNPKVKHIFREVPRTVFGTEVNIISHVTDVWRVDFMVKYGGIYIDTDVAFVRKLDRDIRAYDAVGTYDWTYWNHPFPDTINFGVAIGKRNARYWQLFQESMKWFIDSDWSWNGLRQPYRIKERHPELVLINPHLQITCYQFRCHPTWWPNYHNESVHHLNSYSIKDWRTEAYAFHWTMPTPPEFENEEALVVSDTMFADIGRYILHKAGILKADNRTIVYPNGKELILKVKSKSEANHDTLKK